MFSRQANIQYYINGILAFYLQFGQVITLLNTSNSQLITLPLTFRCQSITLLYEQEITPTATSQQQNAGICGT